MDSELRPASSFAIKITRTTAIRDDRVIKATVEVKSELDQNVDVTLRITGGEFFFVDSKDGKCFANTEKSQTKSVEVAKTGKSTVEFLFRLSEGEFELMARGKAGNEIDEDTRPMKTFQETDSVEKYSDLRSKEQDSFYVPPPKDVTAYETIAHITGNLVNGKLK
jgi:hypothetical protein